MSLGLTSALVRAPLFPTAFEAAGAWSAERGLSVFALAGVPSWMAWLLCVPLLDLTNYAWHIASHRWQPLWRFHCVHHHDDAVDSTTAFRFHAGDAFLSSLVTLLVVAVFGLSVGQVLLYEALVIPASIFHHGNIRMWAGLERGLGWILVTPAIHRVHHSRWVKETDSNYAAVFSFWDRAFGTFVMREDATNIRLGLDGYAESEQATVVGCLATPFLPLRSLEGADTRPASDRVRGSTVTG
jgi:sterol desaturase/sphingolipid hydroxylase (fatty acid hydroxylase superfamily)